MSVSDLMITKAGGMSVTEALNSRLPMILYASIPGQESWTEDFLIKNGAARKAGTLADITRTVDYVLGDEEQYSCMKRSIELIRRPRAADDIVDIVKAGAVGGKG
jgi:processive 1,2-diacylglycerol beta-glucosyltransferase